MDEILNKWNAAIDYSVNAILKKNGFKIPEGSLYDERFAGMSPGEIYEILEGEEKDETK